MNEPRQTNKDPSEAPNKDINKDFNNAVSLYQSSGTQLGAWSSITVSENVDYINEDYQIAVSYRGNSAPKLIIENKYDYSWDVNVTPNDVQDGVAYYNYSDIADRMNTLGVSIYGMGKVFTMASDNTIIYDIYAVPTDSNDYDSSWKEVYGSQGAVTLSAWSSFVATEDLSCINKNYDIAVVYKGNAAPKLVLENKYDYSWNVNIEAAKTTDDNIAYYSYADIAQCFSKYGVSIYDMGKLIFMANCDTEIYGVYAAPVY